MDAISTVISSLFRGWDSVCSQSAVTITPDPSGSADQDGEKE